jgi:hypothetical protein
MREPLTLLDPPPWFPWRAARSIVERQLRPGLHLDRDRRHLVQVYASNFAFTGSHGISIEG